MLRFPRILSRLPGRDRAVVAGGLIALLALPAVPAKAQVQIGTDIASCVAESTEGIASLGIAPNRRRSQPLSSYLAGGVSGGHLDITCESPYEWPLPTVRIQDIGAYGAGVRRLPCGPGGERTSIRVSSWVSQEHAQGVVRIVSDWLCNRWPHDETAGTPEPPSPALPPAVPDPGGTEPAGPTTPPVEPPPPARPPAPPPVITPDPVTPDPVTPSEPEPPLYEPEDGIPDWADGVDRGFLGIPLPYVEDCSGHRHSGLSQKTVEAVVSRQNEMLEAQGLCQRSPQIARPTQPERGLPGGGSGSGDAADEDVPERIQPITESHVDSGDGFAGEECAVDCLGNPFCFSFEQNTGSEREDALRQAHIAAEQSSNAQYELGLCRGATGSPSENCVFDCERVPFCASLPEGELSETAIHRALEASLERAATSTRVKIASGICTGSSPPLTDPVTPPAFTALDCTGAEVPGATQAEADALAVASSATKRENGLCSPTVDPPTTDPTAFTSSDCTGREHEASTQTAANEAAQRATDAARASNLCTENPSFCESDCTGGEHCRPTITAAQAAAIAVSVRARADGLCPQGDDGGNTVPIACIDNKFPDGTPCDAPNNCPLDCEGNPVCRSTPQAAADAVLERDTELLANGRCTTAILPPPPPTECPTGYELLGGKCLPEISGNPDPYDLYESSDCWGRTHYGGSPMEAERKAAAVTHCPSKDIPDTTPAPETCVAGVGQAGRPCGDDSFTALDCAGAPHSGTTKAAAQAAARLASRNLRSRGECQPKVPFCHDGVDLHGNDCGPRLPPVGSCETDHVCHSFTDCTGRVHQNVDQVRAQISAESVRCAPQDRPSSQDCDGVLHYGDTHNEAHLEAELATSAKIAAGTCPGGDEEEEEVTETGEVCEQDCQLEEHCETYERDLYPDGSATTLDGQREREARNAAKRRADAVSDCSLCELDDSWHANDIARDRHCDRAACPSIGCEAADCTGTLHYGETQDEANLLAADAATCLTCPSGEDVSGRNLEEATANCPHLCGGVAHATAREATLACAGEGFDCKGKTYNTQEAADEACAVTETGYYCNGARYASHDEAVRSGNCGVVVAPDPADPIPEGDCPPKDGLEPPWCGAPNSYHRVRRMRTTTERECGIPRYQYDTKTGGYARDKDGNRIQVGTRCRNKTVRKAVWVKELRPDCTRSYVCPNQVAEDAPCSPGKTFSVPGGGVASQQHRSIHGFSATVTQATPADAAQLYCHIEEAWGQSASKISSLVSGSRSGRFLFGEGMAPCPTCAADGALKIPAQSPPSQWPRQSDLQARREYRSRTTASLFTMQQIHRGAIPEMTASEHQALSSTSNSDRDSDVADRAAVARTTNRGQYDHLRPEQVTQRRETAQQRSRSAASSSGQTDALLDAAAKQAAAQAATLGAVDRALDGAKANPRTIAARERWVSGAKGDTQRSRTARARVSEPVLKNDQELDAIIQGRTQHGTTGTSRRR